MNEDRSKLVPFERGRRVIDPARMAEFAATARRLQYERATSAETVAQLLRETRDWKSLAKREELQTSGALESLAKEIDARLDKRPQEALELAQLAVEIAERIDSYPPVTLAQLRAHARKDLGQALTFLAKYDEALAVLDRADQQLTDYGTLTHDRAIVSFVRATALQHLRRFDEAEELLHVCRVIFRTHGDRNLYAKCTLATGNLLVRRGDYHGARKVLTLLVGRSDRDRSAFVHLTLGWCSLNLSDLADAFTHFQEAERLFIETGYESHALRAASSVGSTLLRMGRLSRAIEHLTSVRQRFLAKDLVEEAGLTGLEIVEAHLLQNEAEDAKTLAATIVTEFTAAQLNRRAIAALAYLNEALAASIAKPQIARDVHEYIVALRSDPTRQFATAN